jgi:hypothetical protein
VFFFEGWDLERDSSLVFHNPMCHLTLTSKFKEQIIAKAEAMLAEIASHALTPLFPRF